jgi:hypothetical protein
VDLIEESRRWQEALTDIGGRLAGPDRIIVLSAASFLAQVRPALKKIPAGTTIPAAHQERPAQAS